MNRVIIGIGRGGLGGLEPPQYSERWAEPHQYLTVMYNYYSCYNTIMIYVTASEVVPLFQ